MTRPAHQIELTDAQLERYARHIILRDVGGEGQRRLLTSSVTVIGAGGLGSPVLLYLAAAGVGFIRLIDDDQVSLSNLQRQILYQGSSIGTPKVAQAVDRLRALNPDCRLEPIAQRLDRHNAAQLIGDVDLVIDGCDNFSTRLTVNRHCVATRIPLLSAALGPFDGQIAFFDNRESTSPCYQCFVGDAPNEDGFTCAEEGILGAVSGMIGCWTATEALKHLSGIGSSLIGRLLIVDLMRAETRQVALTKDPDCAVCSESDQRQ